MVAGTAHSSMSGIQIAVFVAAALALVSTLFVIATFFTFAEMRRKRFMKFIFYMSCSDMLVAVMTLIGFPKGGTTGCYVQGVLVDYGVFCSWFWTVALSFVTYNVVITGRTIPDIYLHYVCWLLPLIIVLVPFSNATYGSGNGQWCLIVNDSKSPRNAAFLWSFLGFFGWLFGCTFLMIYWAILVRCKLWGQTDHISKVASATYDRVAWYPVAMIICWMLNFLVIEFAEDSSTLNSLSVISGVSYGTASALIFLVKSEEARRRWYDRVFIMAPRRFGFRESTGDIPIDFADDDEEFSRAPFTTSRLHAGTIITDSGRGTSHGQRETELVGPRSTEFGPESMISTTDGKHRTTGRSVSARLTGVTSITASSSNNSLRSHSAFGLPGDSLAADDA
jgi:hypothetical protein